MKTNSLPAYAADIAAARRRGMTLRNPTVWVELSWRKRAADAGPRPMLGGQPIVIVPNDAEPGALDWSWTRSLEVNIFWRDGDEDRLRSAVAAIAAARPAGILVIDCTDARIIWLGRVSEVRLARAA